MRTKVYATLCAVLAAALALALMPSAGADTPPLPAEKTYAGSVTATNNAALTSAVTGKTIRVLALTAQQSSAGTIVLRDGTGGDQLAVIHIPATQISIGSDVLGEGIETTAGNALFVDEGAGTLNYILRVQEE